MFTKTSPITAQQLNLKSVNSTTKNIEHNTPIVYNIHGDLNKVLFQQACAQLISQHKILHAKYNIDGSIRSYNNYQIKDFYSEHTIDATVSLNTQLNQLVHKPFNLERDTLLKFYLLSSPTNTNTHYVICNAHNIIADHEALAILVNGIATNYNYLLQTEPSSLTNNVIKPSKYNIFSSNISDKSNIGDTIKFTLQNDLTYKLKSYAKNNNLTLCEALTAIYESVLSRYNTSMRHQDYIKLNICQTNMNSLSLNLNQLKTSIIDIDWKYSVANDVELQFDDSFNAVIKLKLIYKCSLFEAKTINLLIRSLIKVISELPNAQ